MQPHKTTISDELFISNYLVVLKDVTSGKCIGVYTNNMTKPAYAIAYYMLQRWGKSENIYKELMAAFNLNYHPGYDIKELEKQPLVDNPDIALTQVRQINEHIFYNIKQLSDLKQLFSALHFYSYIFFT